MISSAVIEFRRGRSAINNSGGMFLGIKEGFQMKVTILKDFAQVGGEGEHNCAETTEYIIKKVE